MRLFFIFILFLPLSAEINNEDFISKQKRFIYELYKNERYFDCISETQRLLSYDKNIPEDEFKYFINSCYYSGGQYKTVISELEHTDNLKSNKTGLKNLFLLSHSYLNIGYYKLGKDTLYKTDYAGIDHDNRDILFANRVEVFLKNYEYKEILSEIENVNHYIAIFNEIYPLHEFKNDILKYHEIGLKSRWLSVSLSALLPGTGQIYSGRIMDGLISLAAVAGSVYGAYYFYKREKMPLAMTFTFFSCLFYGGNLYGAYNSALYTNKDLNNRFADQIVKKYNLYYNPMDYVQTGIFE